MSAIMIDNQGTTYSRKVDGVDLAIVDVPDEFYTLYKVWASLPGDRDGDMSGVLADWLRDHPELIACDSRQSTRLKLFGLALKAAHANGCWFDNGFGNFGQHEDKITDEQIKGAEL